MDPWSDCAAVKDTATGRRRVKQIDDTDRVVEGSGDSSSISCRRKWTVWRLWARNSAMVVGLCDSDVAGAPW
jgi:hypothetical protein